MSTKQKKFHSPFIYTTFTSTDSKTVKEEYQDRILKIYQSKYAGLKDMTVAKVHEITFKLEKQRADKKKKEEEEQKKKEEEEKLKKEQEEKKEEEKDDQKENDEEKRKKEEEEKRKKEAEEAANKDANKEQEKKADDESTKEEKNDEDVAVSQEEKKLLRAFELLNEEYIGREHEFYVFLCKKYDVDKMLDEFTTAQYMTPLLNDYLCEQNNGLLTCYECNHEKLRAEFDLDEFANGAYIACRKCAPDRDSVKALKWHETFRSTGNLRLFESNHIAKQEGNGHQYALIDDTPVKHGIHCWRWKSNKHRTWLMWGISYLQQYDAPTYLKDGVYGISGSNQVYKSGQQVRGLQTTHFYGNQEEQYIDMKLDFGRGELSFLVVGDPKDKMTTIDGLPNNSTKGFVPHIDIYYKEAQCQIKKIPASWFGKNASRVKFQW
eukprot:CAMPEP_0197032784 /NCGR_PEP_ID=MMETSP1384-20130603/11368_1 /TAXON_ID=29189 /ORGANISM="Ammonia sp." /LENGTH=434 /DNA_ID=CAMNT_0042462489 /DNA_START=24 /DNA_END=1328 /DNA_ORIENTATION=+